MYSFKSVLYLDTTAICNQMKYYLTTNRGNFLEMHCGFYRYVFLADLRWLVVKRAFTKNSRKAGTCLFGESSWKIIKALWLIKYSSKFVFIGKRSWNSECPGLWYALVFELTSYKQFHNNLRIFDLLPNFTFTTSETMGDYYL